MYSQENKFCTIKIYMYMYAWILQQFMGGGGDDWV